MSLSSSREKIIYLLTLIALILPPIFAFHFLELDLLIFFNRLQYLGPVLSNFLAITPSALPSIFHQLIISIVLAACGLIIGGILSVGLAIVAAKNIAFSRVLSVGIKSFVSIIRAIPSLILNMMVVASLGFGYNAGVVGLTFSTVGYLTKAFINTIEDVDQATIEAIRATGANWFQVVTEAIFPNVFPSFLSWISIRMESNITESISLGLVGAGGVGFLLSTAIRQHNFPKITTTILVIYMTLVVMELGTTYIKKKLH